MKPHAAAPRGIFDARRGSELFRLMEYVPSEDLAPLIEKYWIVSWDLRGAPPHHQETLPHPAVHLVVEPDRARIYGIGTRKFSRLLSGAGRAVGVKFRPAGFRPFLGRPVRTLTDRVLPAEDVFGPRVATIVQTIHAAVDGQDAAALAEAFVRGHRPAGDANVALVSGVVERILADPSLRKVEDVAHACALSVRSLQRLFREYVGVSPKWVIRRTRLHEALQHLGSGASAGAPDWARLARDLGYFDQAHFTRDFKAIVGRTPAAYARASGVTPV